MGSHSGSCCTFIGIFITMQPALMILKSAGAELGLTHPSQMFWVTGALSSFLDNTPTYLVFLTTAGSMGFVSGLTTALGIVPAKCLQQYHVARYLWEQ